MISASPIRRPLRSGSANVGAGAPTGSPCTGAPFREADAGAAAEAAALGGAGTWTSRASSASNRVRRRPCWARSCVRNQVRAPTPSSPRRPRTTATASPIVSPPSQATALGPTCSGPCQTRRVANVARTAFRASVGQPIGSEWSWPKQWQSGRRPRARLEPMATRKRPSSPRAPTAPHHAVATGTSARATANSASGSRNTRNAATRGGRPKSRSARRVPGRSDSFVPAARPKTAASTRRAVRRRTLKTIVCGVQDRIAKRQQPLLKAGSATSG